MHVLCLGREHGVFCELSDGQAGACGFVPYEAMVRRGHPDSPSIGAVKRALVSDDYHRVIDLRPYANRGCYTVQEHAAAYRCQMLFRTMGLRHLPVLGEDHEVRGMITRQDLYEAAEHTISVRRVSLRKGNSPRNLMENADLDAGNSEASTQI